MSVHMGARYRWNAIRGKVGFENLTMQQALAKYEEEEGERLSLSEKREFFNGWRRGAATFAIDDLHYILNSLNADDMERFGDDLLAFAAKWAKVVKEKA